MIGGTRREFRRGLLGAVPYMYIPSLASASQPAASPPTPLPAAPCSATTTTCNAHKPPPGPAFSTLGQPPPGSECRRRLAPGRNVTGCASPEMRRASRGRGRASLLFRRRERGLRIANPLLRALVAFRALVESPWRLRFFAHSILAGLPRAGLTVAPYH